MLRACVSAAPEGDLLLKRGVTGGALRLREAGGGGRIACCVRRKGPLA